MKISALLSIIYVIYNLLNNKYYLKLSLNDLKEIKNIHIPCR